MGPTAHTLLSIFLLRGRPQDLPASPALAWAAGLAALATDFVLDRLHQDFFERLWFAATQVALFGAVLWLALKLRGYPERWMQTATPLYAASAFINLLSFPVLAGVDRATAEDLTWPLTYGFAMTLWFVAIVTQVLRHALATVLPLALLAAIGCLVTSGLALLLLFPEVMGR
jgi:hypothetical protein